MKKFLSLVLAALLLLSGCEPVAEQKQEPVDEKKEPPKVVNLVAFGDYMVHRPQINGAKTADGFDFTGDFQYLKPYIEAADVAMINLETTLTDGAKGYTTFPLFASPIEIARDLKTVGFDVVSTANNHAYDTFGPGVETTYRALTDAGMDVVGTGENKAEPLIKTVNGMKIGFLSYTYGLNGNDGVMKNSEKPEAVAVYSEEKADEDIKALKAAGVDAIVCFMHWGVEYVKEPTAEQKKQAAYLAKKGVDIIFGSHPHVPLSTDYIVDGDRSTFVAYSMGNFVSNQRREYMNTSRVETGQMVRAQLTKDKKGTRVTAFLPDALYVDKYWGDRLHFDVLPAEAVLSGEIPCPRVEQVRGRLEETLSAHRERVDPNMVLLFKEEKQR